MTSEQDIAITRLIGEGDCQTISDLVKEYNANGDKKIAIAYKSVLPMAALVNFNNIIGGFAKEGLAMLKERDGMLCVRYHPLETVHTSSLTPYEHYGNQNLEIHGDKDNGMAIDGDTVVARWGDYR